MPDYLCSFVIILILSSLTILGVQCLTDNLCGPHQHCVPKEKCRAKYLDEQQHYSCGTSHPGHVCCPSSSQTGHKAQTGYKAQTGQYSGSKLHGGSTGYNYGGSTGYNYGGSTGYNYGGSTGYNYGGSTGYNYGGSTKYNHGGSTRYNRGHAPNYMDFYHDQYEKYFGYTLSKQAKELLRNYRAKEECGVRNQSPADMARISSGYLHDFGLTSFGEFRWHVALLVRQRTFRGSYRPVYRYHCGATLIHKSLLITAAHCVRGIPPRKFLAHLGDWNLQDSTGELFPTIKRRISRIFVHSGYNPGTYLNDIALLQMQEPIDTYKTPHIGPICLPPVNYKLKEHSKCYIVGWGDDLYKPNFGSNILKSVSVTYATDKECSSRLYASLEHVDDDFVLDTDSQKCILGGYGKDACVGDGGGGVVCPLSNDESPDVCNTPNCAAEHYFLFGVISYGSPVCGEDSVTIITDLVENLNWVYTLLEPAGGLKKYDHQYYHKQSNLHIGRTAEEPISAGVNATST